MNKKLLFIGLSILFLIIVIFLFLGIGVHTCYVNYANVNYLGRYVCDKRFSSITDAKFDFDTNILKIRVMKYIGIYKPSCDLFSCGIDATPWITIYDKWIVGSRNCHIQKLGYIRRPGDTPIQEGEDYEVINGTTIKIIYQIQCEKIQNIYTSNWHEEINKTTLIEHGYSLPATFDEKLKLEPKE